MIEFTHDGRVVSVTRGTAASSDVYLYITIDGREFFMGHAFNKSRGEVKGEALAWLQDHPAATSTTEG